jgi:PAS domain S-box-containing protein
METFKGQMTAIEDVWTDPVRIREICDSIEASIFVLDRDGRYLYMSPYAARQLQGTPDDFVHKSLWDVFPGESADRMLKEVLKAFSIGRTHRCELEVIRAGDVRLFTATLHPFRLGTKESPVDACLGVVRDTTEEHRLNANLLHSVRLSAVGQLAAGVAHEFNNILAVIEGLAQIRLAGLERTGRGAQDPTISETADIFRRIINQAERAARITRQVQDFAMPRTGIRGACRLEELLKNAVRLNTPQSGIERVEIETELESGLAVIGDAGQLEQVFMNLLQNARHSIIPKGQGRIKVLLVRSGEQAEIRFIDNGVGMEAKTAERIFEPFFTTKGTASLEKIGIRGTGLGLAVSRSVIEAHDGTIELSSSVPGEGSEFRIFLPLCDPDDAGPDSCAPGLRHSRAVLPDRVLVVEAERELAESLAQSLRDRGCREVAVRFNGSDAVEAVRTALFDAVLLDVSLPDAEISSLISRIRGLDTQVRIICMTGRVDEEVGRWKEWGADGLLRKPFQPEAMIDSLIAGKSG